MRFVNCAEYERGRYSSQVRDGQRAEAGDNTASELAAMSQVPGAAFVERRQERAEERVDDAVDVDEGEADAVSEDERRAAFRFPVQINVTYESEHNFYSGLTNNLSTGGLFVATYQPLAIGLLIELSFTIPGMERACEVTCEVRWLRDQDLSDSEFAPGMGLRFVDLCPEDLSCIERFARHREPIFFDDEL